MLTLYYNSIGDQCHVLPCSLQKDKTSLLRKCFKSQDSHLVGKIEFSEHLFSSNKY